jgi:hypothetical protein
MRNGIGYSLAVTASFLVLFVFIGSCNSVPVAPNESIVEGVVSEYAVLSSRLVNVKPEMTLYRITVRLESTARIGGGPDFLSDRIGQDVQLYSKEKVDVDIYGKKVKAKVTLRGDERGRTFWIREIEIK